MYANKSANLKVLCSSYVIKRFKGFRKQYWSQNSKKTTAIGRAQAHFDEFYGSVFGERWESMRKALQRNPKYVALVNNYGDEQETVERLNNIGAHNVGRLFSAQKRFIENAETKETAVETDQYDNIVKGFINQMNQEEISAMYGGNSRDVVMPDTVELSKSVLKQSQFETVQPDKPNDYTPTDSLIDNLKQIDIDESRVIEPSEGMNSGALWSFVPASRIKGRDDFLPESHYYNYYHKSKDFPLIIEEDDICEFPEHLKVYAFEPGNQSKFPEPKRGQANVFNYYIMDGGSIMPIIAMGLNAGDRVLDMCAAPGGKSLAALQTMLPDILIANDKSSARNRRLQSVFKDYLHDYETNNKWRERAIISQMNALALVDEDGFDKVLVDVPCTTDRLTIKENENNIFSAPRIKERLRIPEEQSALLSHALSLCKVGGVVIYSTCTFSPIQNDGVVHMSLKNVFENKGIEAKIMKTNKLVEVAKSLYRFGMGRAAPKYGQLITPHILSNFGPMYFAKIVRTR